MRTTILVFVVGSVALAFACAPDVVSDLQVGTGEVKAKPDAGPPQPPVCNANESMATISLVASAPIGTSEAHLGKPLDAHFESFAGPDGATLFPTGAVRKQALARMEHRIATMDTKRSKEANLGAWYKGFSGEVNVGNVKEKRFGSYRASQLAEFREIDDATEMRGAPKGAVWYISRIFYGRSFELVVTGDSRTFNAGVKAKFFVFKGGAKTLTQTTGLTANAIGRGLEPTSGDAIFAQSPEEITAAYKATGEPVPIYVEYRTIPRACVPNDEDETWLMPHNARVTFDRIDIYEGGKMLWDLEATCLINDKETFLDNGTIWSRKEGIRADCGLTDVRGPKGAPDYCRYDLYWATNLSVFDGDRVRCGVKGTAGDRMTKLPNSEFSEVVAKDTKVSSTFGDGDTTFEYRVHYTLTRDKDP